MPQNKPNTKIEDECDCVYCHHARTAIAHGTLQRPEVSSGEWVEELDSVLRLAEELRNEAQEKRGDLKDYLRHDRVLQFLEKLSAKRSSSTTLRRLRPKLNQRGLIKLRKHLING